MATVHEVFNDSININEYTFYQVHKFWSLPPAFNRFGDDFPAKISWAAAIWLILLVQLMDQD